MVSVKDALTTQAKPGLGAPIIATVPGEPGQAVVFGCGKGAAMNDETIAPARRMMLLPDNETSGTLTSVGLALFDAAIDGMAGQARRQLTLAASGNRRPGRAGAGVLRRG
ncbi:hypothetical protein FF100_07265 [Methylobacterium terricola]|uniref:Uncharacterized protein n=1 Tax=Methylobacterium terricola TaxID=2583531 RepID=A0A5C4LN92_9HYPH|nr:hypothetical protein [Methylobacterium terricola]TNC15338.1 hypothetical protein FF100_07265 [Methylobacterium terricola]